MSFSGQQWSSSWLLKEELCKISKYCDAPEEPCPAVGQLKAEEPRGVFLLLPWGQIWSWLLGKVAVRAECEGLRAAAWPLLCPQACPGNCCCEMEQGQGCFQKPVGEKGITGIAGRSPASLCPLDPTALLKYLGSAGPGLCLEECHLWEFDSGARGN